MEIMYTSLCVCSLCGSGVVLWTDYSVWKPDSWGRVLQHRPSGTGNETEHLATHAFCSARFSPANDVRVTPGSWTVRPREDTRMAGAEGEGQKLIAEFEPPAVRTA